MSTIYPGRVVQIDPAGPVVIVPALARSAPWGPLPTMVADLAIGESVAVSSLGGSRDQLLILGRMAGRAPEIGEVPGLTAQLDALDTRIDALQIDQGADHLVLDEHEMRLDGLDTRATSIEGVNTTQNGRLDGLETNSATTTALNTLRTDTAGRATTKGDLLAATASGVLARQAAPSNGLALVADSAQTTGWTSRDLLGMPKALTGAVAATRYVGALSAAGPPSTGTFAVGDFVLDSAQHLWVCSVAGTPGTWVSRTKLASDGLVTQGAFEKYSWHGTGTVVHNAEPLITAWPTADAGNATRIPSPNTTSGAVTLGRAGRWSIGVGVRSDHPSPGMTRLTLSWAGGAFGGGFTTLVDSRWHGSGFASAGEAHQWVRWSGWVSTAQAAEPITAFVFSVTSDATSVSETHHMNLEYLGGA